MGGGFLLRDVSRYSGPEGGAEPVFMAVLVMVDSVVVLVCLCSSWIDLRYSSTISVL